MAGEVTRVRSILPAVIAVVLAACGQAATPVTGTDYKLYVAAMTHHGAQLVVVDSRTQRTDHTLPLGVPSADWQHLYWVGSGRVVDTDPLSGATLNTMALPGDYQLPVASVNGLPGGLSQNGHWLTLEGWDRNAQGNPTATHLFVVDTALKSTPASVDLTGFYEFDAISNDGQRLYLVEYTGANGYRVRVYNLVDRLLDPQVVVDKSDGDDAMAGVRLMGVFSAGGTWQYSVYARQNDGAFIHALNMDGNVSACIFLPGPGYAQSPAAFRWSLALNRGGDVLYASNSELGYVAKINVGDNTWPGQAAVARIPVPAAASSTLVQDVQAKEFGGGDASAVSADGSTLVTGGVSGVMWLETAGLTLHRTALDGWRVWSVGLSPDGRELYVLNDEGMLAQVSMASGAVEARFNPGAGQPLGLMRVATPGT
jgi:hypothetical protein